MCANDVLGSHLSPAHTDDAVHAAACIIEEGHSDSMLAGWQPVTFGRRVDLEDMGSGAEDGLLPLKNRDEYMSQFIKASMGKVGGMQRNHMLIRSFGSSCYIVLRQHIQ